MRKIISPIGIPKVPFQDVNDTTPQWVDIYSRLYKERILLLFQVLDDDFVNQMIATLFYLDFDNQKKPIYFYINSIGGSLMGGIAIYDLMQYIKSDVITVCMGVASSVSSLILANGKYPRRAILPHSRIILQESITQFYGQASDLVIESEVIIRLRKIIGKIYIEHTTQTLSRIARDLDRDCFLSSREAKNYGLVDEILGY